MSSRFTVYLGCTGIVALLVIVFPAIVLVARFAGVVPGFLLAITPSLFCYSLAWWCARALVQRLVTPRWVAPASDAGRRALGAAAGGIAAVIVALPAFLVPQAINSSFAESVAGLRADDRDRQGPVAFPPVTAIVLKDSYDPRKKTLLCETLCQRLLYSGAVARIVVADGVPARAVGAFWVERRDQCPEPALPRSDIRWPVDFPLRAGEAPEQRVRARIAAGECLMQGDGRVEEAGATIAFGTVKAGADSLGHPWALWLDTVRANRLELVEHGGRVLYRRTEVTLEPLAVPLVIGTRAGLLTSVTYVGWARSQLTHGQIGPHGRDVLPDLLGAAARLSNTAAR
jgi:hypothetical protein